MNLYYFNPNGQGWEAFVMANSEEEAKEYIRQSPPPGETQEEIDWHKELVERLVNLKGNYTVEEHPLGTVIFSEMS